MTSAGEGLVCNYSHPRIYSIVWFFSREERIVKPIIHMTGEREVSKLRSIKCKTRQMKEKERMIVSEFNSKWIGEKKKRNRYILKEAYD